MENEKSSLKVNKLVGYIRQLDFPFDTHDELEEILNYYGLFMDLGSDDKPILLDEIHKLAEEEQTSEITRTILQDDERYDDQGWDDEC